MWKPVCASIAESGNPGDMMGSRALYRRMPAGFDPVERPGSGVAGGGMRCHGGEERGIRAAAPGGDENGAEERALAGTALHQQALYRLVDRLQHAGSLGHVVNAALAAVPAALHAERAAVLLLDDAGAMRFAGSHGLPNEVLRALEDACPWPQDAKEPRLVCIADIAVARPSGALMQALEAAGIGALYRIPLVVRGTPVGEFAVCYGSPRRWSSTERGFALRLAGRVAFAVVRKRAEMALIEGERRKDELLATLAHELRNTVAPIRNATDIIELQGAGDAATKAAQDIIERQVGHMVRLIDDLLDASRVTTGKLQLRKQRIALGPVIDDAIEISRPCLRHELSVTLPPESIWLNADPVRLVQVFANLLNNAFRYTKPGGRVSLAVKCEGACAVATVKDDGIGISPRDLPHVFEMFSQASSRSDRSRGGLGVGLALVRGVVEMHGGTVVARSAGRGSGSEFEVRLPLQERTGAPGHAAARSRHAFMAPSLPRRRVLVVDGNAGAADSVAMLLGALGQEVVAACDTASALAQAESKPPAFAIIDLAVPDIDGAALARGFRSHPVLAKVVLVALTGRGRPGDFQRARKAGFHRHLVKPLNPDALVRLLRGHVSQPGK